LEKQVNKLNKFLMLNKSIKLFLTVLVLGNIFQAKAQERVPFDQGREYILAGVSVIGKISYNEQTVVTFAGLEKGQRITVSRRRNQ
jgi:outer membrane protein insertion porin family